MILVLACCTTILIIVTPNMGLNSHENEISYQVTKNKAINRKRGRVELTLSSSVNLFFSERFVSHFIVLFLNKRDVLNK